MFGPITPLLVAEVIAAVMAGMLGLSFSIIGLAVLTGRLADR